jgi:16S rRNA (guanine527-N7)-methyltransferase
MARNSLLYTMLNSGDTCLESAWRLLPAGAAALGLELSQIHIEQFARYGQRLLEAREHVNLTSIKIPDDVMRRHILDSLTVFPILDDRLNRSAAIIDVGTGAGMPGLALAIMRSTWLVTLVDSVAKKTKFVEDVVDGLELSNVNVVTGRAEALAQSSYRDRFDACVVRAVAGTPVAVEYCAPFVRPGGVLMLYKSGDAEAERAAAERAGAHLATRLVRIHPTNDQDDGNNRFLIELKKIGPTPPGFPRRLGVARSRTL